MQPLLLGAASVNEDAPHWLPNPLVIRGQRIQDIYASLHREYVQDFVTNTLPIHIDNCLVVVNTTIDTQIPGEYTHGFTHLITRTNGGLRLYDELRAAKICWVRPILEHYQDSAVRTFWATNPEGERSLYLWLYEYDYVVILRHLQSTLEREKADKILVTAYPIYANRIPYFNRLFDADDTIIL